MSNNNGQNGRPAAPQQQLSPPTDPRKRNVPSTSMSQTTQQRVRSSGSRSDRFSSATMPMTSSPSVPAPSSSSGSEHPPLYPGYVPRALPIPPPPANVIALRDVLLMPPPPPPPLPQTTTSTAPPQYTAPPSVAPAYSCGHQIPKDNEAQTKVVNVLGADLREACGITVFDPTQPPPVLRPQQNASRKRGADNIQAGPPSKVRQTELPDGPCPECVQRDIRTSIYQEQSVKLEQEYKLYESQYNNRLENVENGKLWLKSILSPRQYSLMDNFVETGWSANNLSSEPSLASLASYLHGTPVAPRQSLLDQVLDAFFGGARNLNNSISHLQPSTSLEDPLLQLLSGGGRRNTATTATPSDSSLGVLLEALRGSSSTETASTSSSPDMLQAMLEALRPDSEQRGSSERAGGSSNGLNRLANGAVSSSPLSAPAPAPYAIRPAQPAAPPPVRPYYAQPYPPPVPAPGPAPQTAPTTPAYYAQQSQQPTPARPYYAPRYAPGAPQPPAHQFASPYYATARPPMLDTRAPPPQNQYTQFGPPYGQFYPSGPSGPPY